MCLIEVKRLGGQFTEHGLMNTPSSSPNSPARRFFGLIAWVLGAIGAYFLLTRHFDHVLQAVPFVLLLACPLMHVFGHRHGHGAHQKEHGERSKDD